MEWGGIDDQSVLVSFWVDFGAVPGRVSRLGQLLLKRSLEISFWLSLMLYVYVYRP